MITAAQLRAIARIRVLSGDQIVDFGTGFLVAPDQLLTALHVVAETPAAGVAKGQLHVDFLAYDGHDPVTIEAHLAAGGSDSLQDWALLELHEAPAAEVLVLARSAPVTSGTSFNSHGFLSANAVDGLSVQGEVRNPHGTYNNAQAFQLYSEETKGVPVKGLSGAPCLIGGKVVGVIRAALMRHDLGLGTLYSSPSDRLIGSGVLDSVLGNPFKGLRPYEARDENLFFGRDADIERILGTLNPHRRLSILVGSSGSGKSSLARAGLLPAIAGGAGPQTPGPFRSIVLRVMRKPYQELIDSLSRASLLEQLAEGERRGSAQELAAKVDSHLGVGSAASAPSTLLLLVDQMEELFSPAVAAEERKRFLETLWALANRRHGHSWVMATLRSDFIGDLLSLVADSDWVRDAMQIVGPLTRKGLEEVIRRPLAAVGLSIDDDLVERLIDEVAGEPGALPLLQFALHRLWEERVGSAVTWSSYKAIGGGVHGTITRAADRVMAELDAERDWPVAQRVFLELVDLASSAGTRRRASINLLRHLAPEVSGPLVDRFVAARLLTVSEDHVEIAHEVMIRDWQQLRAWIHDAQARAEGRRELERAMADWREQDASSLLRGSRLDRVLATSLESMEQLEHDHPQTARYLLISAATAGRNLHKMLSAMGTATPLSAARFLLGRGSVRERKTGITILEQIDGRHDEIAKMLRDLIEESPDAVVADRAAEALWKRGRGGDLIAAVEQGSGRSPEVDRVHWVLAHLRNHPELAAPAKQWLLGARFRRARGLAAFRLLWDEGRLTPLLLMTTVCSYAFYLLFGFLQTSLSFGPQLELRSLRIGALDFLLLFALASALYKRRWIDNQRFTRRDALWVGVGVVAIAGGLRFIGRLFELIFAFDIDALTNLLSVAAQMLVEVGILGWIATIFVPKHPPIDPWKRIWIIAIAASFWGSLCFEIAIPWLVSHAFELRGPEFDGYFLREGFGPHLSHFLSSWLSGSVMIGLGLSVFLHWLSLPGEAKVKSTWVEPLTFLLPAKAAKHSPFRLRPFAWAGGIALALIAAFFLIDLPLTLEQRHERGSRRLSRGQLDQGANDLRISCYGGLPESCERLARRLENTGGESRREAAVLYAFACHRQEDGGRCRGLDSLLQAEASTSISYLAVATVCRECGYAEACDTLERRDQWQADSTGGDVSEQPAVDPAAPAPGEIWRQLKDAALLERDRALDGEACWQRVRAADNKAAVEKARPGAQEG